MSVVAEVQDISEDENSDDDEGAEDNDSLGNLDQEDMEAADQVLQQMWIERDNNAQQDQNVEAQPVNHIIQEEVIMEEPDEMPPLQEENSTEEVMEEVQIEVVFEVESPPNSPPDLQDEGVGDLHHDAVQDDLQNQEPIYPELDEGDMVYFRLLSWQNLTENRQQYSGKPYESTYSYNNLNEYRPLKKLLLTTSTLAGCNNTAGGDNRVHSIEVRGGTVSQVLDAARVELGSLACQVQMRVIVLAGLNDVSKHYFNLEHTLDRYRELKNYLKQLNPSNVVIFAGMPIPPKLSSLLDDNHLVLQDRTKEILYLNHKLRTELSDYQHSVTMEDLGITPVHTGQVDVIEYKGEIFVTGASHRMNQWTERNPLNAMHLSDRVRRVFFRDQILTYLNEAD